MGMIPVAKTAAQAPRTGGPTAPPQHPMLTVEVGAGVTGVRIGDEIGIRLEAGSGPFPDIAQQIVATEETATLGERADRGGAAKAAIAITKLAGGHWGAGIPREGGDLVVDGLPPSRVFPLGFGGQALACKASVGFSFVPAHATHWMMLPRGIV